MVLRKWSCPLPDGPVAIVLPPSPNGPAKMVLPPPRWSCDSSPARLRSAATVGKPPPMGCNSPALPNGSVLIILLRAEFRELLPVILEVPDVRPSPTAVLPKTLGHAFL